MVEPTPSKLLEQIPSSEAPPPPFSASDGRWTTEEHRRFLQALSCHGKDWRLIQTEVGSRTMQQVRSHGQKYFLRLKRQERSRKVSGSALPSSLLEKQNSLMREYILAIAHIQISFFTEMQKLMLNAPNSQPFVDSSGYGLSLFTSQDSETLTPSQETLDP